MYVVWRFGVYWRDDWVWNSIQKYTYVATDSCECCVSVHNCLREWACEYLEIDDKHIYVYISMKMSDLLKG